jgi:hypothetical protein
MIHGLRVGSVFDPFDGHDDGVQHAAIRHALGIAN